MQSLKLRQVKILLFSVTLLLSFAFIHGCDEETTAPTPVSCNMSFEEPIEFPVGNIVHSVLIRDIFGDENPDLIVPNYGDDNISISLGNNSTYFSDSTIEYEVGDGPWAIYAGKINDDTLIDLAVACDNSGTVAILYNEGDGTFGNAYSKAVRVRCRSIIGADLNNDGCTDLVTGNASMQHISVLLNNCFGTFEDAVNYTITDLNDKDTIGDPAWSIAVADFDGDEYKDLAIAGFLTDSVHIQLNDGDGAFGDPQLNSSYRTGKAPRAIEAADLNGDGAVDLATVNYYSNNVSVFLNNGSGGFSAAANYTTGALPTSISVADFDGDDDLDIATTSVMSMTVNVLENNGSGSFTGMCTFEAGDEPFAMFSTDINQDGLKDIFIANRSAYNLFVDSVACDTITVDSVECDTIPVACPSSVLLLLNDHD